MFPTMPIRKPYPSDVSDDEWEFIAPYLTLLALDALVSRRQSIEDAVLTMRLPLAIGA